MRPVDNRTVLLYITVSGLLLVSLWAVWNATHTSSGYRYILKQLIWVIVGGSLFMLVKTYDYRYLAKYAKWLYIYGILLLLALFIFGKKVNGATSWIDLGAFRMQPSEVTRITTLLLLAKIYEQCKGQCNQVKHIGVFTGVLALPTLLVLLQPDLGMALIYLSLTGCFLILTKLSKSLQVSLLGSVAVLLLLFSGTYQFAHQHLSEVLRPHQWERLTSFLHPDDDPLGSGYQYIQAKKIVGSGQLHGIGIPRVLKNGGRLPEQHTDFIFAVIAQRGGFVGSSLLLLLYFVMFFILVQFAMTTPDPFASFFISGMVTMWAFQVYVNIGMNIGLSPITGLTLPFISYGGSSLISNMLGLGLVMAMREPSPLWTLEKLEK